MRKFTLTTVASVVFSSVCALAATPFDGAYKGGSANAGGGRCPPGSSFDIFVRDGEFTWRTPGEAIKVKIGPDGSFSGQAGARIVTGRVAGSTMTATTTGASCNYTWSLTK